MSTTFIITADAQVLSTTSLRAAKEYDATQPGATVAPEFVLDGVPTAMLVRLYNCAAEKGDGKVITKFADRKTAARRMSGILDFPATPLPAAEPVAKSPKAPKEPKIKAERRGAPKKEIDDMLLDATIALRRQGRTWQQIVHELEQPFNFIFRVRPLIKQHHPDMVKALGPGSPNYGKKEQKPRVKGERKVRQPSAPVVAF